MNTNFLKTVLLLDAAVTGVNGIAYLALSSFINDKLGYPTMLQTEAGIFLLAFALFVLFAATRKTISKGSVMFIVAVNVLWPIASIVALAAGWLEATTLGAVWAVLQAVVVAAFAGLQEYGLAKAAKK